MQILYVKNYPDGYKKISAIQEDVHSFGSAELDSNNFGILLADVTAEQITDWANLNKYCVNETEDAIIETPVEFQRSLEVME